MEYRKAHTKSPALAPQSPRAAPTVSSCSEMAIIKPATERPNPGDTVLAGNNEVAPGVVTIVEPLVDLSGQEQEIGANLPAGGSDPSEVGVAGVSSSLMEGIGGLPILGGVTAHANDPYSDNSLTPSTGLPQYTSGVAIPAKGEEDLKMQQQNQAMRQQQHFYQQQQQQQQQGYYSSQQMMGLQPPGIQLGQIPMNQLGMHPQSMGHPQPIGHPQSMGHPQPIGHPQSMGHPQPMGQPRSMGQPQTMGHPQPIGQPQPMGHPQSMGHPQPIGQPQPMGHPQSMGHPQPMGNPQPIGHPQPMEHFQPMGQHLSQSQMYEMVNSRALALQRQVRKY